MINIYKEYKNKQTHAANTAQCFTSMKIETSPFFIPTPRQLKDVSELSRIERIAP
jgi:hypothetical protein